MSLYLHMAIKSLAHDSVKEWYIIIEANVLNVYSSEVINNKLDFKMLINVSTFYDGALKMFIPWSNSTTNIDEQRG